MEYKYSPGENFEDLSAGRVLLQKAGGTNFPVRLSREIFGRCLSYTGRNGQISVYDPCCGSGYLLTVLGFLFPGVISCLTGSDIDENAVRFAADNLGLLNAEGIRKRKEHLENLYKLHGKQTYAGAVESAERLAVTAERSAVTVNVFTADAAKYDYAHAGIKADIVITDVPYGSRASWQGVNPEINALLANLVPCLGAGSVLAVCSDKAQKISCPQYKRLEKQVVGKRKFEILRLSPY